MNTEQDYSALLIGWLNGHPCSVLHGKTSKASIRRILDLKASLTKVLLAVLDLPAGTMIATQPKSLDPLIRDLNERLALYASTPTFTLYDGKSWGIDDHLDTYRISVGESLAGRSLCEIAYRRELYRVRTCLCGAWFYATRDNQNSCSAACRKSKHQQTDAFKEKRRVYMRGYYKLKNSGKVK